MMNKPSDLMLSPDQLTKLKSRQLKELCEGVGRVLKPQRKERDLGDILSPK